MTFRRTAALVIAASLIAGSVPAREPANYTSYSGFSVPEDVILPAKEVHPSLWFKAGDEAAVRAKKDGDEHARKLWNIMAESRFLSDPLPTYPEGDKDKEAVHKYYGAMPQIAALSAFMYRMETDATRKKAFGERAKAALLRAYDGKLYEIDPKKNSTAADEIYRGTWLQHWAIAYDCAQELLTPEENTKVRAAIKKESVYLSTHLFDLADSPHNHLSKPGWGLGSIALTLSDEPEAKQWLAQCLKASNMNTRYFFSSDGIYREGSQYYIFSLINFVPFLYNYKNVSGVNLFPQFQPAFEWPILIRNGKGWMPNIEDSFIRPYPSEMVASAYKGTKTRLSERGDLAGVLQWNLANTDYKAFDPKDTGGFNYSGASWDYNVELFEYLCYDPSIKASSPDVSATQFLDSGESAFRNDWSFNDPKHRYLLFQGVAEADNHAHADHLSFIFQAENQMMASDAGYTRSGYRDKERLGWYVTPEAHNIVTAGGEPPVDPRENVTPISTTRVDTDWFDFEEKEAPYAKGGKLRRAIAFIDNDFWVVFDRVTLPEPRDISVMFHGGRGTMEGSGSHWTWNYKPDAYGGAAALDVFAFPDDFKTESKKGEVSYIKGDWIEAPYTKSTKTADNAWHVQVFHPRASGDPAYSLEAPGLIAGKGNSLDFYAASVKPSKLELGNVLAVASFALVRGTKDGPAKFILHEGRSLATAHGALFQSDSPVTVAATLEGGAVASLVIGATKETLITLPVPSANTPPEESRRPSVGKPEKEAPTGWSYAPDYKTILATVPAGTTRLEVKW